MKKTVLALSAAAVCVASAAPVLAEGQNPMTAPVQISMQGEASMTVANDEAVILFSAKPQARCGLGLERCGQARQRGDRGAQALQRQDRRRDDGALDQSRLYPCQGRRGFRDRSLGGPRDPARYGA